MGPFYPEGESAMSRPPRTVIEYRNYELPADFPIQMLSGENWRISDVPSARHHGVDGLFDLCFVKNQSCHLIISPFAIRPRGLLRQLLLLCTPSRASSWPFQTISVQFRSFINWGVGRFLHDSGRFFHVFRADLSVSHKLCTFCLYELHINRRFWQRRVVFSADRAYNGAILSGRRIRHVPAAAHRH